jgi:hypothetical protein
VIKGKPGDCNEYICKVIESLIYSERVMYELLGEFRIFTLAVQSWASWSSHQDHLLSSPPAALASPLPKKGAGDSQ